jgi:8-oxo-dGTP pyrophosphatase MutT (NUDIX family)
MLVRDAPGLQVFMMRRNLQSRWVAGAYLFPGGAVDPEDATPELAGRVHGLDAAVADARLGVGPGAMRFWVAAIRESFEEAGVLLARDAATGEPLDLSSDEAVDDLALDRRMLITGEQTFQQIVERRGLALDAGALHVFARWITPPGGARRYDTWFFVAPAPEGHAYIHDDDELVASEWLRPVDALERARREEIQLIYPTYRSLQGLARYETAASLLADVRDAWREPTPRLVEVQPGNGWVLPFDAAEDADRQADAIVHSTRSRRAEAG